MTTTSPDISPAVLSEIGDLLSRHGLSERFGLFDVHDHFQMNDGEVMHEINDELGRVLLRRPVAASDLPPAARPTSWLVAKDGSTTVDTWCCD